MTTTNPGNLGNIVTNAIARKTIYGTYVVALVLAGGVQVAFATPGLGGQPLWLTVTLNVLAYCGVPIGGLALANTSTQPPNASGTLVQNITSDVNPDALAKALALVSQQSTAIGDHAGPVGD